MYSNANFFIYYLSIIQVITFFDCFILYLIGSMT